MDVCTALAHRAHLPTPARARQRAAGEGLVRASRGRGMRGGLRAALAGRVSGLGSLGRAVFRVSSAVGYLQGAPAGVEERGHLRLVQHIRQLVAKAPSCGLGRADPPAPVNEGEGHHTSRDAVGGRR